MGKFEYSIREKRSVPHPTRGDLNFNEWKNQYEELRSDKRDDELFFAGSWVYERLLAARKQKDEISRHFPSGTPVLRLAVADINRHTRYVTAKHQDQIKKIASEGMAVNPGVVARLPLQEGGRNEFPSDSLVSLIGDVLGHLFRNFGTTPSNIYYACRADTARAIHDLVGVMLLISQLENIWQSCIWLENSITEDHESIYLRSAREDVARSIASSQDRFNNNCLAVSAACIESWKKGIRLEPCIRWAEHVSAGDSRLSFVVSDWRDKDTPPDPYLMRRAALAGVPTELLKQPLPLFDNLTINELFDGLEALQSLCTLFCARQGVELDDELDSPWLDAPVVMASDCARLIADACGFDDQKAKKVVDILTLVSGKTRDGAWERPLIPAGNGAVYFSFPVLLTTSPIRLVDHWLIEGGFSTQDKGSGLEKVARDELAQALAQNTILTDANVYEHGLRLEGNNKPEIDALVRIGRTVLVCEIKSLMFPVTFQEIHKYTRKVFGEGIRQVGEELKMAIRHRNKIAECTRFAGNPKEIIFKNVVLVKGRIGSGLVVDDTPVLDVELLAQYLSSGTLEFIHDTKDAFGRGAERIELYTNQNSAEENLGAYLLSPPTEVLRHHHVINAIVETKDPFDGRNLIIDNLVVQEFSTLEEMRAAIATVRRKWIASTAQCGAPSCPT